MPGGGYAFLHEFSCGPECGVALLSGEVAERLIEGDEAGVRGLREGQQPAIADPLGCGLSGEGFSGLSKAGFRVPWLGTEFHARVFEPAVVDCPRFAQRERLLAHHHIVGEQAQQPKLCVSGKDNAIIGWQERLPLPG